MTANNNIMATALDSFPMSFGIHNQYQGEGLPVLYIVSDVQKNHPSLQWQLSLSLADGQHYTFKGLSASPSAQQYHWFIRFRQGTLHQSTIAAFKTTLQAALNKAIPAQQATVSDPVTSAGNVTWYIRFQKDLSMGSDAQGKPWEITLGLGGMVAAAGTGSRSTQVAFGCAQLLLNNTGHPLRFTRSVHLDIINHLGSAHAPLHFGVIGKNVLLNQPGQPQQLKLYFQTIGRTPIKTGSDTIVEFAFSYDTASSNLIHFGNKNEVSQYVLSANLNGTVQAGQDDQNGQYTLGLAYKAGVTLSTDTFHFQHLQLSGPDGMATIQVTVRNLPGFWDTTFPVAIHKETSALLGELELGHALTRGHIGLGSRIDFLSSNKNSQGISNVSIEESWGLNLYGTLTQSGAQGTNNGWAGQPVKVRNADLLVPEGRLAINGGTDYPKPETGDTNPNEKLNVNGDTFLDGHVGISGDTGIAGQATFQKQVQVTYPTGATNGLLVGPAPKNGFAGLFISIPSGASGWPLQIQDSKGNNILHVEGSGKMVSNDRFHDKSGPVMPVGTIVAFGGSTVPPGWLLCNGQSITKTSHPDLFAVLNSETVPDLRSRFIVGTGQGTGLSNYNLTDSGGEESHTLSEEEMPSHQHFTYGEDPNAFDGGWRWGYQDSNQQGAQGMDANNSYLGTSWAGGNSGKDGYGQSKGTTQAHNNLPPFYALTYIIKY